MKLSSTGCKEAEEIGEFMSDYSRYALYFLPEPGPLADFGAKWLGWDAQAAQVCKPYALPDWDDITMTPRKYGFHATLKPPFRLTPGQGAKALAAAVADLAAHTAPAQADGLALTRLGSFLALTPLGDASEIGRVASACVTGLDRFRAPPTEAELERRRKSRLSPAQEAHLTRWGYPYVHDQFRFHMTLSGRLPADRLAAVETHLNAHLPPLPRPFRLDSVCLLGERADTRFELIHRYTLSG
ncbi:DUF1045 domain-containing protein [Mesobacterium sp. TK19101]|uniref:DUF1045 domain-containing protein n=1 Tax=Mesobacterium hydrothermale TaxID=3111907 RepID=A0ABU6HMA5_9RHOB|nr:DUF1045 domain-containing protein [Mesobacterium sp. TK19101]MEC3862583.1 DUF1045 domain-containing protein [Mesobacterium sp. TK19101]